MRLYRWKVDPNTFRIVGGITSNNIGDLGLTSDNCCSGSGGSDYGTISGHKYWDLNCNGIRENGEPGVANWTITLSRPGTPSQTNTTDANGWYSFTNLLPGVIYTVTESSKVGWFNGATSSYSLALGSGQSAIRDFLNCKKPECSNLLTEEGGDEECCQYSFNLSNGLGKLSKLDYTVTGGALKYIETESCIPTSVSPNITFASSSGTLSYVPSCNNSVDVKFGAYSTTASGLVCVKFKFTFEYGTGSFTCDTTICFQCDRMPKDCGDALKVIPHVFGSNNTDWHFFSVSNVKAPISRISSIDLNFFPPPTTGHIGGSSIATSVDPAGFWGIGSYAWTPANSGGPSAPYSKIRLNCSGNSLPHGPAASNSVWFQLGVDKLLNYNGSVQVKVGYCDGDTCEFIYRWIAPTNNGAGKVVAKNISSAPRIFSLDITPIDSTESFTVSIADTAASIIAISAPDPTELNTGNLFGLSGSVSGNSAMYKTNVSNASEMKIPTVNTNIVFVPSKTGSSDSTSIIIRYYGKEGNEIGTTSKVINTSKITTSVNQPLTNPAKGDVFINSIIPNPGSGTMTCTYSLGAGENARLELFNTLGQSVALISDSFTAQGSHQKSFNVTSLAEGIYHLRLTTPSNEAVVTVKVIH